MNNFFQIKNLIIIIKIKKNKWIDLLLIKILVLKETQMIKNNLYKIMNKAVKKG